VKLGTFHFNSHFKLFAEESYSPKMSKVPKAAPKVHLGKSNVTEVVVSNVFYFHPYLGK